MNFNNNDIDKLQIICFSKREQYADQRVHKYEILNKFKLEIICFLKREQ